MCMVVRAKSVLHVLNPQRIRFSASFALEGLGWTLCSGNEFSVREITKELPVAECSLGAGNFT